MQTNTVKSLDEIPAALFKSHGPDSIEQLAILFTNIIEGADILEVWGQSRVIFTLKQGGKPDNIQDYCLITITSVFYCFFTHILKGWINKSDEATRVITEIVDSARTDVLKETYSH